MQEMSLKLLQKSPSKRKKGEGRRLSLHSFINIHRCASRVTKWNLRGFPDPLLHNKHVAAFPQLQIFSGATVLTESFLSILPLSSLKSAPAPSIFFKLFKHLPLFQCAWEPWPARRMKRPTSKDLLTPDLSLPRDNPCRFHLGGTALTPSPCISNNRSGSFPTNREWTRGKDPHKNGRRAPHSPKESRAFRPKYSLCSAFTTIGVQRGTHKHTHVHTHMSTKLRERERERRIKGESDWLLLQMCTWNWLHEGPYAIEENAISAGVKIVLEVQSELSLSRIRSPHTHQVNNENGSFVGG